MLRLLFRRIPSISRSRRFFRSSRMESPRGSSDRIVVPVASTGYRICPSPSVGLLPINSSRTRPTNDDAATVDSVHRRRPISSLLFNKERSISCSITIRTRNKKKEDGQIYDNEGKRQASRYWPFTEATIIHVIYYNGGRRHHKYT